MSEPNEETKKALSEDLSKEKRYSTFAEMVKDMGRWPLEDDDEIDFSAMRPVIMVNDVMLTAEDVRRLMTALDECVEVLDQYADISSLNEDCPNDAMRARDIAKTALARARGET